MLNRVEVFPGISSPGFYTGVRNGAGVGLRKPLSNPPRWQFHPPILKGGTLCKFPIRVM